MADNHQELAQNLMQLSEKFAVPIEFMNDYSKDSSIHGVKYFSETQRHWLEKTIWITIFVTSMAFCIQNVHEIYVKRISDPTMISFSKGLTPTYTIPFPAVTICPESKASKHAIDLSTVLTSELSTQDIEKLQALYQVCDFNENETFIDKLNSSQPQIDIISMLKKLAHPMDEMFYRCRYGSRKFVNCKELFNEVITDEGVCWAFNMLDQSDLYTRNMDESLKLPNHGESSNWFLEKNYKSQDPNVFPRRIIGSGIQSGLYVEMKMKKSDLNPGCKHGIQGFRLALHTPAEVPRLQKHYFSIPFRKRTLIATNLKRVYASKHIEKYDPISRQCFFRNERKLTFNEIYSKSACDVESSTKQTLASCGCVKFSMPHDNKTKVCDYSKLDCIDEAERNYTIQDLNWNLLNKQLQKELKYGKIKEDDQKFDKLGKMESCDCLLQCTALSYDAEISQTDFTIEEDPDYVTAGIVVYFKLSHFTSLKRLERYAWSDVLSNTGGLFGLFLGCSLISFIEIIYHLFAYVLRRFILKKPEVKPRMSVIFR